jgi:hypothetical protein
VCPPGERDDYPAKGRIAAKYNSRFVPTAEVAAGGKNGFEFGVEPGVAERCQSLRSMSNTLSVPFSTVKVRPDLSGSK